MAGLARKRVRDAEILLNQADNNMHNREVFRANFGAFISQARSVLNILKNEVDAAGVMPCFQTEWDAIRKDPLAEFFRCTRNMVLKEGRDPAHAVHSLTITMGATAKFTANVVVQRPGGAPELKEIEPVLPMPPQPLPAPIQHDSTRYFFDEGSYKDEEVMVKCREYLRRLEQAIAAAEKCGA